MFFFSRNLQCTDYVQWIEWKDRNKQAFVLCWASSPLAYSISYWYRLQKESKKIIPGFLEKVCLNYNIIRSNSNKMINQFPWKGEDLCKKHVFFFHRLDIYHLFLYKTKIIWKHRQKSGVTDHSTNSLDM